MTNLRAHLLTRPIYALAQRVMPALSDTEREALEAGDVWWDGDLFSGVPDWDKFLKFAPAALSPEEKAFIAGSATELCAMLDDWRITWELKDLPPEVWDFLKSHKFFGMIIPKEFGGLGFSAFAHSEVVRMISTRSIAAAVTVMVPNSLGPGELLMRFGTKEQQAHWLPRLADGREIPCFGLTSPQAGSDAAAMTDKGVVCRGTFEGREVLGLRLTWHKRYITLGPVASVLGLAFKLFDPDHLLGPETERGITVALIPTRLSGVEIGRRHLPALQAFQNGPNWGRDVFIPLDFIIGGPDRIGQGWKMLMTALAAGRGISLPSLSAAGAALAARTTGAYARIREQFHVSIGKFEGIQEHLARIAATAYLLDAARRLTCAGLDQGHHPAVIAAIMKSQATERMRTAINDAMDIHGGKTVIDGPRNYLGNVYRSIPVGITVEGANILTRNLMIYGQGAIRCHPYLLEEMLALSDSDRKAGLDRFDKAFWKHVGHAIGVTFRALLYSSLGFAPAPDAGKATGFYRSLSRYSACFAFLSEVALLTLGGALKRKEMLSARMGDILAELYLLSAALKRWHDDGKPAEDFSLLAACMETGFETIEAKFVQILANLPNRFAAWIARLVVLPWGAHRRGPSDHLKQRCAELLLAPSATRDRLTHNVFPGNPTDEVARLEKAFALVVAAEPLRQRLHKDKIQPTQSEQSQLDAMQEAVDAVIEVDDFAARELLGP
jgi:acyl-CoA dehydrogenase